MSVNVFSTKVLIGDTTMSNISYWRWGGDGATILCGHPSPRRSSCLQAKGSTFISQPRLLVWPCESKYWPPTQQSSAQLTELILPWLRKALQNSPKVQLRHNPNNTKTSKWPVVSRSQSTPPTDRNPAKMGCKAAFNNNQSTYFLILEYPTLHSFTTPPSQVLHTLLFSTSSRTAYSQEHLKTIT